MPVFANVIEEAFSPLISVFQAILVFIHNDVVGGSWGLAIIGLTVIIRAVMVPLTLKQLRSMQKMQLLAPKLKEIQAKYKEDRQRQGEEVMKFYKEHGVNPFASCLPLLLQLPVFVSLFYMLRTDLKKHICGAQLTAHHILSSKAIEKTSCNQVAPHSAKFLFIPDITHQATGAVLIVLMVLYIVSQLGSTLLMSATGPAGSRGVMMALPFLFVLFIFRFPAGLLVYWITTNLWTMGQQYFVRHRISPPPLAVSPAGVNGPSISPSSSNGSPDGLSAGSATPALVGAGAGSATPSATRRKKKRSGRRR